MERDKVIKIQKIGGGEVEPKKKTLLRFCDFCEKEASEMVF